MRAPDQGKEALIIAEKGGFVKKGRGKCWSLLFLS